MKNRLILILLVVTICFTVLPTTALAARQALPSGLPNHEIESIIDTYLETNKDTTAAVSIAVFRGQETLYKRGYGYANIENQIAVDDETVYEWGSVSKILVWVSVMQLWEQGKIVLEEDIREYLPKGYLTKLRYDKPITMLNLMNHNAGWEDTVFQMNAVDASSILSLEDALKVTEPHQVYEPDAAVAYSNWGVSLAGYIVERISGQKFFEYVQDNIFMPLGMEHSSMSPIYSDNQWVQSKLMENEGYTTDLKPLGDGLMFLNLYPSGSAAGTLEDFITFAKALVPNSQGSKHLFEKSETHTEMYSPTLSYPGTDIDHVNHGFWSHEFNVQTLGHGGNTMMYSSYLMIDPISGVGLVVMTNQNNDMVHNHGLPPLIFGKLGKMAAKDERTSPYDIEGLYYSARTIREGIGKMYTVLGLRQYTANSNGGFYASLFGMLEIKGEQIAPNTFFVTQKAGSMEMNSLDRYSYSNGTRKLSAAYGDALEADASIKILIVAIALYAIAMLWSLITLLSNFVKFIIRKVKKRERTNDTLKKYQLILCLAITLPIIVIVFVAGKMFGLEATLNELIPYVVVSIVLGLLPFAYTILLIKKWRKLTCSKKQKVSYIITMLMGFVMSFVIYALDLYKL